MASHVTLVSISGGDSDVQVPPHLTIPNSVLVPRTSSPVLPPPIAAYAVPRNWVSADHRAVVWWEVPFPYLTSSLHHKIILQVS